MRRMTIVVAMATVLGGATACSAAPRASSGSGALALAALVGGSSPHLSCADRRALSAMLAGHPPARAPARIVVSADAVACRASDVDLSAHGCTLQFGRAKRVLQGRTAHELYATLVENGVASDGAAGSVYESVRGLACTVRPGEVRQRNGGGAACRWTPF